MARPPLSRPMAVFGAVCGVAVLVFGLLTFRLDQPFIWVWVVFGIGVIGYALWSSFRE